MSTKQEMIEQMTESRFDDDAKAWDVLKYCFGVTQGGIIYPYDTGKKITKFQWKAIAYLCDEWDYDYEENPQEVISTVS